MRRGSWELVPTISAVIASWMEDGELISGKLPHILIILESRVHNIPSLDQRVLNAKRAPESTQPSWYSLDSNDP